MKLRFNREELADALAALCTVAASRTPKEILKCVLVDAHSDVVFLAATDLELSLRCAVTQVEVEKPGKAVVAADTLNRIVHESADTTMLLETDAKQMHVRGTGCHFRLVTQTAEEFPPVPVMDGDPTFTVDHGSLLRQIEWTVLAAARETSRFAINGVLWELDGEALTLAATDGRRLAVAPGKASASGGDRVPMVIVPTKALSVFSRLSREDGGAVSVKVTENMLLLSVGGAELGTALVEGTFPNYRDVVPTDCDRVAKINRQEFLGALRQASLLTNEESKGVRLAFGKGDLTISSRAPEQGDATVSIPVEFQHEGLEIGFNPVFLLDVLRVMDGDEVTLAMRDSNRPGLIRGQDDYVYIVMPVNLQSAERKG